MHQESHPWWRFDRRVKTFYEKYERWFIPALLVAGFVTDVVTFRTLNVKTSMIILGVQAILAASSILYGHVYDSWQEMPKKFWRYLRVITALLAQYSLGNLLSASLVFYWFSGAFSVSWPLFGIIVGLMISTEVLRQWYLRPGVQISLYAFALFSYFSMLFPYVFHSIKVWTFIAAGVLSTAMTIVLIFALTHIVKSLRDDRPMMISGVLAVWLTMNVFYFMNVIPPIPLSLREAGVYHDIQRRGDTYELIGEEENFFQKLVPGQTIHANKGDTLYTFTAIYAPTDVTTRIYHDWEYFDPVQKKWVSKSRSSFTIRGGRQDGFRGYTLTSQTMPGKWRVTAENTRGQVVGRVSFTVVEPKE